MRVLFVLNPTAGGTSKDGWKGSIAQYFPAGGEHTHAFFTMAGEDCSDACQSALAAFKPDRVGAIGDGTLKFAAEMLLGTDIPLAFLPAGSANGMARELGLPAGPDECLDILIRGTPKAMDAVRLNGHLSIHLSDLGLNAQLVKYFDEGEGRGMMGYAKQVMRVMRNGHQMRLRISVDGGAPARRRAWIIVVANARTYGTGAAVNPDGLLYDGRFEIVLLKRRWFWEMVRMLVRRQASENNRLTEILSVQKATIATRRAAHFQVDGEYVGKVREVEVVIEMGAVMMLAPDAAGT